MDKSHFYQGLYTPLLVPIRPWNLLRTPRGKDVIMVVVDGFSKIANVIAFHKCDDTTCVVDLFFQEIMRLHGIPRTIVLYKDAKFLLQFGDAYLVGTNLLFITNYHPQIDGQIEVTIQTLITLLRSMVSKTLRDWDTKLSC